MAVNHRGLGFAASREHAQAAGRKGGAISRALAQPTAQVEGLARRQLERELRYQRREVKRLTNRIRRMERERYILIATMRRDKLKLAEVLHDRSISSSDSGSVSVRGRARHVPAPRGQNVAA